MDAANARLHAMSAHGEGESAFCARQILQTPSAWRGWELEFGSAMRPVVRYRNRLLRVRTLRQNALSWVHSAAPFRYVRNQRLRGEQRRRFIVGIHRQQGFNAAMVAEHSTYVRSICSVDCSGYISETLLGDLLFQRSMARYERLYMDYFTTWCSITFPDPLRHSAAHPELLKLLKLQVYELRQALLEYPLRIGWLQREAEIRQRTGATQSLRSLEP
jgi:hypothetical protein